MVSKVILITAVIAYVEARFGQEQVPISAISAVKGGASGAAATIAGATVSDLLGAANSCAKLSRADQIVSELGGGADAIAAAIGLVAAEKNTNPFANNNTQNVCGDASLPATPELRGITPLIDPAVDVNGAVAALSKQTQASPLKADGMSVFDLLSAAGFGNLNQNQGNASQAAGNANANAGNNAAAADPCSQVDAGAAAGNATQDATGNANSNAGNANAGNNANAGAAAGVQASSIAGLDFGECTPTITFQGGEGNRPATEFTFQIADPVARGGQGEALNPNIITNALCNQLTNVCDANAAAKAACLDAKAKVAAAGTRDKSTADLFNTALGFAGAVTNPAGGP
ncbi:hypothetical protein EK21DRAFT_51267, partial [Setomelanomma holmii]